MAEFYVSASEDDMASQIANMINQYNKWYTKFLASSVKMTNSRYFVELYGKTVAGVASNMRESHDLSKIQHICVLPEYRCKGIAKRLTKLAIEYCDTEFVYMTIREDNAESVALANTLGFRAIKKYWFRDHWTLTFGRRKIDE